MINIKSTIKKVSLNTVQIEYKYILKRPKPKKRSIIIIKKVILRLI